MKEKTKKYIIVDGNNTVHRMYHAYKTLFSIVKKKRIPTGAMYGLIRNLMYLREKYPKHEIYYAFDSLKLIRKKEMFKEYKANRVPKEQDLIESFIMCESVLMMLGYTLLYANGYEADDIIYSMVKVMRSNAKREGRKAKFIVVSSDHDLYQLIKNYCFIMPNRKKHEDELITPSKFFEAYGIEPKYWIDVMALAGCKGDNVPGIPGVAEPTAIKLIKEFTTISNLYENIEQLPKGKLKEKLIAMKESVVYRNYVLLKPLEIPLKEVIYDQYVPDLKALRQLFEKLGFRQYLLEHNWEKIEKLVARQ